MKPNATPQVTAARLKKVSRLRPTLAIVLGSGFHHALTELRVDKKISYTKIPGFPKPGVSGHAGELYFGHLGKTPVMVLSGRAHFYEGHSMEQVTFAVRALAAFGIRDLLLTNAAGGINPGFRRGDFMVLTDHINFMGVNPLRPSGCDASSPERSATGGAQPRFVDLTETYDKKLRELLFKAGKISKLKLQRGVYLAVSGPSYETPAEIRAFAKLGADIHKLIAALAAAGFNRLATGDGLTAFSASRKVPAPRIWYRISMRSPSTRCTENGRRKMMSASVVMRRCTN